MDKSYISEFTVFINRYLEEHPDVVEDQRRGWAIYWNPKIDPVALNETKESTIPDDGYGFSWSAWHVRPSDAKKDLKKAGRLS